nr:hypothetical protein [Colwellia sp.]
MSKESNKQKLFNLLLLNNEWLGLSAILALGHTFKERTLRRLLSELRDVDKLVEQQGKGRSTRYRAILNSTNNIFGTKASLVIQAIRQPIYERTPVSYNKAWVDSYIPNKTFYFNEQQLN